MKFKILSILLLVLVLIASCDRPDCTNENPIFDNYNPNSKIYKDELVYQLKKIDQSKLTYWFKKYDKRGKDETLYFNIQSDEICAILHLNVDNWTKLEDIRVRKGVGRRGAELTNLKFRIEQDTTSTKFIYETYDILID